MNEGRFPETDDEFFDVMVPVQLQERGLVQRRYRPGS
jgi:hypothetical protein